MARTCCCSASHDLVDMVCMKKLLSEICFYSFSYRQILINFQIPTYTFHQVVYFVLLGMSSALVIAFSLHPRHAAGT